MGGWFREAYNLVTAILTLLLLLLLSLFSEAVNSYFSTLYQIAIWSAILFRSTLIGSKCLSSSCTDYDMINKGDDRAVLLRILPLPVPRQLCIWPPLPCQGAVVFVFESIKKHSLCDWILLCVITFIEGMSRGLFQLCLVHRKVQEVFVNHYKKTSVHCSGNKIKLLRFSVLQQPFRPEVEQVDSDQNQTAIFL